MPQILDNIEKKLLPTLQESIKISNRADFCVGYFNLRGWKHLVSSIDRFTGKDDNCCRLLVGMQALPQDILRRAIGLSKKDEILDNSTAIQLRQKLADDFKKQLTLGTPSNEDEIGLQKLACQIRSGKVKVKLFLRYPLHAKLYLLYRQDPISPVISYLGSSNLTYAGLYRQGELNVDVPDQDACKKLVNWFEERWNDRWCIDISDELVRIINTSWAREDLVPPYHIYIKMAYHLSQEAREGLVEFRIPKDFGNQLFEFQKAAVQIAAHHLNRRGGVMIGDVVGLGKTLMATALARIFEDDQDLETLIICPKNLVKMWEDYRLKYRLRGKVLSISKVQNELPDLRRFRVVIIDESHNLRNREGKRYSAIQEYIRENDSRVILLTATPYNKDYIDLANQLRLFLSEDKDLGIRPDRMLRDIDITEFNATYQIPIKSLAAFEKSIYPDDWRELMRLFLIRRTRSFIQENYAIEDPESRRKYIEFEDGRRSYFPTRVPKTVKFQIDDKDPNDQYARLFSQEVVDIVNGLSLPRYGLGNFIEPNPANPPTTEEENILEDLSRAGKRLMGFCRTNLFKRLESGGHAFIQSVKRHILRNYIYLYAYENDLSFPIGGQDTVMLNSRVFDRDADGLTGDIDLDDGNDNDDSGFDIDHLSKEAFNQSAKNIYNTFKTVYFRRFKWIRSDLFTEDLANGLRNDAEALLGVLKKYGEWNPESDTKLDELQKLIEKHHPNEKILVFSQFADTVNYLTEQLKKRGIKALEGVTGDSPDPTLVAYLFSPESNEQLGKINPNDELRVVISTDVLSEGQNLQDCSIVVNYDLPWAIIRLIQRAGRVDRIGQKSENIYCYSFLPTDGVEKIIALRSRVRARLIQNAEVLGTDEAFFEDDKNDQALIDLYNENSKVLDDDPDSEVDLASKAFEIWKKAIEADPKLESIIKNLPDVIYATKPHVSSKENPEGVLVYLKTPDGNDALAWLDREGNSISESQYEILKIAACEPDTGALPRHETHHSLVEKGVKYILKEQKYVGGQLGRRSGARYRAYERLKKYAEDNKDTIFDTPELAKAIELIYKYPLRSTARDTLNRQFRSGISNETLAEIVTALYQENRLCVIPEDVEPEEPRIICSMGLVDNTGE